MAISSRAELKDDVFLRIATTLGTLSTCDRAAVGAVIVRDGRAVSWGYNGAPPGAPHCLENDHGWDNVPIDNVYKGLGCRNATHAEANALAFAARQGISTDGATLYVTISPCEVCSRLLIAAGIVRVCYDELYRDESGLDLLYDSGVKLVRP